MTSTATSCRSIRRQATGPTCATIILVQCIRVGEETPAYGGTREVINKGKNLIAHFDTPIAGAAANFALADRLYTNKTMRQLAEMWSDHMRHSVPGYPDNMVLTQEMMRNPDFAIPFLQQHIKGEAGGTYPMSERDWRMAHGMFTGQYP
jgi:hypothetical protein